MVITVLHELQYNLVNHVFRDEHCSLIVIKGEDGSGKSSLIQRVLSNFSDYKIVEIDSPKDTELVYSRIEKTIALELKKGNLIIEQPSYASYEEHLLNLLDNLCLYCTETIFYLKKYESYPNELQKLIERFIKKILILSENSIKFIVEINTNSESYKELKASYSIEKLASRNNIISLNKISISDVEEILKERYISYSISKENIDSIAEASFFNIGKLNYLLKYLETNNFIFFQNNVWECERLNRELILEFFREYIYNRYEMLSDKHKSTLKRASIVDYYIDVNNSILQNIIDIKNLENTLESIQYLSNLIIKNTDQFRFENHEVYLYIQEQTNESEKLEWHKLIGNCLSNSIRNNEKLNRNDGINIRNRIAFHYYKAECFENAMNYHVSCLPILLSLNNFEQLDKKLFDISRLAIKVPEMSSGYRQMIRAYEAFTKLNLGQYGCALAIFRELLYHNDIFDDYNIYLMKYQLCYCYFNVGEIIKPKHELEELKNLILETIKNSYSEEESLPYQLILIDVLHLLSTICGHIGNKKMSTRYYEWCKNSCSNLKNKEFVDKYYGLLGKANRHYIYEISRKEMEKAYHHFQDYIPLELAKIAHNLGTEHMINGQLGLAEKYLLESFDVLKKASSNDLHYPLNNLGALYSYMGLHQKALDYFEKASKFDKEFFSEIWICMNEANCLKLLGNYEKAFQLYQSSVERINSHYEDTSLLKVYLFANIGIYYYEQHQYNLALEHLINAKAIRVEVLNSDFGVPLIDYYINKIYSIRNNEQSYNIKLDSYTQLCSELGVFYGDFMFWGP